MPDDPADQDYEDDVVSAVSEDVADEESSSEFEVLPSPSPALRPTRAGMSGAQVSRRDAPRSSQRTLRTSAYLNNGFGPIEEDAVAKELSTLGVAAGSVVGTKRAADGDSPTPAPRKRRVLPPAFARK
jgi:hypothetical protein